MSTVYYVLQCQPLGVSSPTVSPVTIHPDQNIIPYFINIGDLSPKFLFVSPKILQLVVKFVINVSYTLVNKPYITLKYYDRWKKFVQKSLTRKHVIEYRFKKWANYTKLRINIRNTIQDRIFLIIRYYYMKNYFVMWKSGVRRKQTVDKLICLHKEKWKNRKNNNKYNTKYHATQAIFYYLEI